MNIKINKKEASILLKREQGRFLIGSYLYGTQKDTSDKDILIIYESFNIDMEHIFQIRHQLQWDDEENNIDYIFTTRNQFYMNLFSGESTINADTVLFGDILETYGPDIKLNMCRSYNIIKAYIGFAKRDLRYNKDSKKYKHIVRSLYTASCLLNNIMPLLSNIQEIKLDKFSKTDKELKLWHNELREKCNKMYENNELKMYPEIYKEKDGINALQLKLLKSCNIKEFRYGN